MQQLLHNCDPTCSVTLLSSEIFLQDMLRSGLAESCKSVSPGQAVIAALNVMVPGSSCSLSNSWQRANAVCTLKPQRGGCGATPCKVLQKRQSCLPLTGASKCCNDLGDSADFMLRLARIQLYFQGDHAPALQSAFEVQWAPWTVLADIALSPWRC